MVFHPPNYGKSFDISSKMSQKFLLRGELYKNIMVSQLNHLLSQSNIKHINGYFAKFLVVALFSKKKKETQSRNKLWGNILSRS